MNKRYKFTAFLFLFNLFTTSALAIQPGEIKVLSHFYEPLIVSFTLEDIDVSDIDRISVSLADAATYERQGLTKAGYLERLNFTKIVTGKDRQLVVVITSSQKNMEPGLDFLVDVSDSNSSLIHLYRLELDPNDLGNYKPAGSARISHELSPRELSPADKLNRPSIQVGKTDISTIAQNSPMHKDYSVYQIMRAFYLLNAHAFEKGNINRLKSGSTLIIPERSSVAEVTRQQAINFVYSVSNNIPD